MTSTTAPKPTSNPTTPISMPIESNDLTTKTVDNTHISLKNNTQKSHIQSVKSPTNSPLNSPSNVNHSLSTTQQTMPSTDNSQSSTDELKEEMKEESKLNNQSPILKRQYTGELLREKERYGKLLENDTPNKLKPQKLSKLEKSHAKQFACEVCSDYNNMVKELIENSSTQFDKKLELTPNLILGNAEEVSSKKYDRLQEIKNIDLKKEMDDHSGEMTAFFDVLKFSHSMLGEIPAPLGSEKKISDNIAKNDRSKLKIGDRDLVFYTDNHRIEGEVKRFRISDKRKFQEHYNKANTQLKEDKKGVSTPYKSSTFTNTLMKKPVLNLIDMRFKPEDIKHQNNLVHTNTEMLNNARLGLIESTFGIETSKFNNHISGISTEDYQNLVNNKINSSDLAGGKNAKTFTVVINYDSILNDPSSRQQAIFLVIEPNSMTEPKGKIYEVTHNKE